MVRLVFRHFAAASTRVSPDFALLRLFSRFFRVLTHTLLLKQHARERSVAGACVYVCVCVCLKKPEGKSKNCVWYGVCVVWCCGVSKHKKTQETCGQLSKTRSSSLARYGQTWTSKRSENGHFLQRIVFTLPLGFADVFRP